MFEDPRVLRPSCYRICDGSSEKMFVSGTSAVADEERFIR